MTEEIRNPFLRIRAHLGKKGSPLHPISLDCPISKIRELAFFSNEFQKARPLVFVQHVTSFAGSATRLYAIEQNRANVVRLARSLTLLQVDQF
jgi:hypothetical protein